MIKEIKILENHANLLAESVQVLLFAEVNRFTGNFNSPRIRDRQAIQALQQGRLASTGRANELV